MKSQRRYEITLFFNSFTHAVSLPFRFVVCSIAFVAFVVFDCFSPPWTPPTLNGQSGMCKGGSSENQTNQQINMTKQPNLGQGYKTNKTNEKPKDVVRSHCVSIVLFVLLPFRSDLVIVPLLLLLLLFVIGFTSLDTAHTQRPIGDVRRRQQRQPSKSTKTYMKTIKS